MCLKMYQKSLGKLSPTANADTVAGFMGKI